MHGAELTYKALQILPAHSPLGGWDGQEAVQFLDLALWESNRPCLGVYNPPEDFLDARLILLSGQKLIGQHQFLGFPL